MLSKDEEAKFIAASKKSPQSFKPLYEDNYLFIIRYLSARMEYLEDAEDLTADVFIKAMSGLNDYRITEVPFRFWLLRIARNMLYNSQKKKGLQRVINFNLEDLQDVTTSTSNKKANILKLLIEQLNLLDQKGIEFIELRYFEKRSFKEIGLLLSISENNAKVSTYRALDRLKKNMPS